MNDYTEKIHSLIREKGRMLIAGEFVKSQSGRSFPTYDPAKENLICEVPFASEEDVKQAVGGQPLDPLTEMGCLASRDQYEKTLNYIDLG